MKRLYATIDLTEAEILRAFLRDQGIESSLDQEGGAAGPIGINVRNEDAPAAAEALGRHFEKKDAESNEPVMQTPEEPGRRPFARRFLVLLFCFLPGIIGAALHFDKPWQIALAGAAGVLSLVAFIRVADLIAETRASERP